MVSRRLIQRQRKILLGIAIAIPVVIVGRILIGIDDWGRDWSTNYAEVGPVGSDSPPNELTDQICLWIGEQAQWKLQSADRSVPTEHHLKLTRKTLILSFTDDIEVKIAGKENGRSDIFASSRSRIGKGDLGQNPRNLKELLSAVQ